ncbi:MAG: hypothetical protein A3A16_03430 [Candidatus Harrisonbacteria bacterium RIFCSPLOWO2_01_FULL_44_18]|uniref:Transcription elongation factor GreA n=1 Tax=Candidatus Harrisonbacteria bacterium RIFCSPLOWO2_01_FULL_44_18 TaxID=1798407 RepID=A0A1G1ZNZ7_9BACT|nr:MAG: hypothetical protein A3A16_03430 [Candidatus Harrisonbacteria bacterium RIFCSPLOWO2_01_FULL_44_18]
MRISRRKSDEFRKWDDGPVYLTEEGFRYLREKLARLKSALPDLSAEARRTAEYGDRSDNAEYKEAKSILRRASWQILSIQDQIKRVVVIRLGPNVSGTVQLGSTVVLEVDPANPLQADGGRKTFQIVGSRETDPARGRVSNQSPLGAALMNRAKGDTITIHPPTGGGSGSRKYRILEIR